ncbi:MAG: LacI family DNA-binding transcriptional regulator [Phycisphaerales bacterium]|nr:LacI family DNA-binding transcriptional regulator [Phycisphaerales bacterium]
MAETRKTQRITLAKVAEMAGVAESTASRVMNGYTHNFRVRPEVRQRVLEAAKTLNYRPNPMVRSISAKQTNLVAVVGWASDGINRSALSEAVRVLRNGGKHVCTTFLDPDYAGHELPSWRVDGAIAHQVREYKDLKELEDNDMPYVSINGLAGPGGDAVNFNEHHGMDQALDHLIELGHTKIAYAYIDPTRPGAVHRPRHTSVDLRKSAYEQILRHRGLEPVDGYDRFDHDSLTYCQLVLLSTKATAVIAYDDTTALSIIQALNTLGVSVPKDMSVVAFNDELPAQLATPALTTIALPASIAGRTAGEMLLDRLKSDEPIPSRTVTLDETLIIRHSTSVPRVFDA